MPAASTSIFISHSSKDEWIVTPFVDKILNSGMGILRSRIFYTSNRDTGIKSGTDFRKAIQTKLRSAGAVIQIISQNYKQSEVCLNEMGAAWILSKTVIPFIIPPIYFSSVGFIHEPNQLLKLTDEPDLFKFSQDHKNLRSTTRFDVSNYHRQVKEFLDAASRGSYGYPRWS